MAKIEQTGRGKSVESKLDAEPESNHFAILQELVRDRTRCANTGSRIPSITSVAWASAWPHASHSGQP
jgi:hypothetical protein